MPYQYLYHWWWEVILKRIKIAVPFSVSILASCIKPAFSNARIAFTFDGYGSTITDFTSDSTLHINEINSLITL